MDLIQRLEGGWALKMLLRKQVITDVYTLYKSSGLFWYRGYFKEKEGVYDIASQYEVDAILDYFDVEAIFVGHTIVDNITSK